MIGLIALLAFVALALAGWAGTLAQRGREAARASVHRRLAALVGPLRTPAEGAILKDERLSQIGPLDSAIAQRRLGAAAIRLARQAGVRRRPGDLLLAIPLFGIAAALVALLAGAPGSAAVAVGTAVAGTPILLARRRRRRRAERFADQLPDALDMTRAALQAGHSLASAFAIVADELPDPIAEEFRDLTQEMRLGVTMRDALGNLCGRVDNDDLPILVVGILIAQEAGGNLGEVLGNLTYTIRERFKMQRETEVLTAQGRLSGRVLTSLPVLLAGLMWVCAPAYFTPMVESPTGQMLLLYAIVSLACGHLVIRQMTRIRV